MALCMLCKNDMHTYILDVEMYVANGVFIIQYAYQYCIHARMHAHTHSLTHSECVF